MTEFFQLLFIGIANLVYNFALGVSELAVFGGERWWWQLRWQLLVLYLGENPYATIKREGPRAPVPVANLVYGETPCLTIRDILQEVGFNETDHFIDLGCGRGLTVFFVHLHFKLPATGIEVIPSFVRRAERITRRLKLKGVNFERENLAWLTMEQIGKGTIFYMAGTTFQEELLAKITLRLEMLPAGVRLITLSEALPSEQFRVTAVKPYYFSWGSTDVYFQEKIC